jgi:hypothetical protein
MSYIPGDYWRICDRSGRKVRASQTVRQWDGLIVALDEYEERHPQDFVRGRRDFQSVPDPRPEMVDSFIGPLITTTAAVASAGATTLSVVSSVRFGGGDHIHVTLESGDVHPAIVQSVLSPTSLLLTAPIPYSVASGANVVNYSAVAEPDIG